MRWKNYQPRIVIFLMSNQHVNIDRPNISSILIGEQEAIVHGFSSFDVAVFELELSKFIHHINIF